MSVEAENLAVAARLREARTGNGMTQAKLAGSRYSVAYVSRIESGERTPSPEALAYFAGRLGISPSDLLSPVDRETQVRLEYLQLTATRALDAGDLDGAVRAAEELRDLAAGLGAGGFHARALRALGDATERLGDVERAIELYRQAQAAGGSGLAVEDRFEIVVLIARAYRTLGDFGHAADLLERALADLRPEVHLHPAIAARICTHLVVTYHERGDLVRARQVANEGLEHARAAGDRRTLANALWAAAPPVAVADPARALSLIRRAGTLYAELGARLELGRLYSATGDIALVAGDRVTARTSFERALEILEETEYPSQLAHTLESVASLELDEGNTDAAIDVARRALSYAESSDPYTAAHIKRTLGRALVERDPAEAEALLRDAVARFTEFGMHLEAARSYRHLGDLLMKSGRQAEALEAFRQGLGVVEGAA